MTDRLTEIRNRLEAATPGPFRRDCAGRILAQIDGTEMQIAEVYASDDARFFKYAISDIAFLLAELEKQAWRPIESAPKTGLDFKTLDFLAWCPDATAREGGDRRVVWWEPEIKVWWCDGDFVVNPMHWMPLPKPPTQTGEPL